MEETLPSFNSWSYIYGKGILGDNTGRQVLKQSRNEEEWGIEDSKKKKCCRMSPGVFTDVQKNKWSRNNSKEQEGQEFLCLRGK